VKLSLPWALPNVLTGLRVAAGLAVIGAVSSEAAAPVPVPAVTIANLGGGFAILALLWWLRQTALEAGASPAAHVPRSPWLSMLATFTLIAVIGQIALGALVSAKFAALACPAFPLCGADAPSGTLLEAFDPFTALALDDSNAIVRPAALASLQWVHRVGAHVVLVLGTVLAVALIRDVRLKQCGIALVALLVVQLALGAAAVLAQVPLALVLAHNLVAALLLGTLVTINCRLCA
jgi:cytochrome c oxidase assembly protein subunit 15